MVYSNLEAELARKKISKKTFSELLGIDINTLANKINAKTDWKLSEIEIILKTFPGLPMDYLFKKNTK